MNKNTLVLVGSGIKFMSHITHEAKNCIEKADKVLYLVNEPAMQQWIQTLNPHTESLDPLYVRYHSRNDNYKLIAGYILENLETTNLLCLVVYGHPTVLVQSSIYATQAAHEKGHNVVVMPGISAEACLFADLVIDPSSSGCQSFEATDFLIYRREYDSSSHLILWQPSVIGMKDRPVNHNPERGLQILGEYLSHKYSPAHEIILYEAAQYPTFKPRIEKVVLGNLPSSRVTRLTTLYIPPNSAKKPDFELCKKLEAII